MEKKITITICEASDEGFLYDIYLNKLPEDIDEDTESDDGGQCTSDKLEDAVAMANEHAVEFIKQLTEQA